MTNSDAPLNHFVESILRRLEALEARCSLLESAQSDSRKNSPQEPCADTTADDPLACLNATIEYRRCERLAYFQEHPAALAAVREDVARLNDYLVERGLRPLADRYPELSNSAGTASQVESGHNPAP